MAINKNNKKFNSILADTSVDSKPLGSVHTEESVEVKKKRDISLLKEVDADKKAPSKKTGNFFTRLFGKKDKSVDILAVPVLTASNITKVVPNEDIINKEDGKNLDISSDVISKIKNLDLGEDADLEIKNYDESPKDIESKGEDSKVESTKEANTKEKSTKERDVQEASTKEVDIKAQDIKVDSKEASKLDGQELESKRSLKDTKEPSVKSVSLDDISPKAIRVEEYLDEKSLNLNLANLKTIKDSLLEAEAKARELSLKASSEEGHKVSEDKKQTILLDELSNPHFKLYEIKTPDDKKDASKDVLKEKIPAVDEAKIQTKAINTEASLPQEAQAEEAKTQEEKPKEAQTQEIKTQDATMQEVKSEPISPKRIEDKSKDLESNTEDALKKNPEVLDVSKDSNLANSESKPSLLSFKKPPKNPKHIAKKKSNKALLKLSIIIIIIVIILVVLYRILAGGIHIKDVSIAGIEVQNVFLKLENKFVLTIDKVDVMDSKAKQENTKTIEENVNDAINYIQKSIFIFSYFKFLEIKDISINHKYTGSVRFDGKSYILKTPLVNASFSIVSEGRDLVLNVRQFLIKGFDAILGGDLIYSVPKKELAFNIKANFTRKEALTFTGISTTKKLRLSTQSTNLASLAMFKKYFDLIEDEHLKATLEEWLYTNIAYSSLKIEDLRFDVRLDPKDIAYDFLHKTHAKISFTDLKVTLAQGLDPIEAPNAYLTYKDRGLYIKTPKASFNEAVLDNSSVDIVNMPHPDIHINIIAQNAVLDESLERLLEHYDVHMPLKQLAIPSKSTLEAFRLASKDKAQNLDATKTNAESLSTENKEASKEEGLQEVKQEEVKQEEDENKEVKQQEDTQSTKEEASNKASTDREQSESSSTQDSQEGDGGDLSSAMLDNTMKVSLAMNLIYNPETKKDEFTTKGIITGKNMQLALFDYPLSAKDLQVALDINHTQEMIYITGNDVTYKDLVNGNMQASLDLKTEVLKANTLIKKATINTNDLDKFTPITESTNTKDKPLQKEALGLFYFDDRLGVKPYGASVLKTAFNGSLADASLNNPSEVSDVAPSLLQPSDIESKDKNLYYELHSDIEASKPSQPKDSIDSIDQSLKGTPKEEIVTSPSSLDEDDTTNALKAPQTPSTPIIITPIPPLESNPSSVGETSKQPSLDTKTQENATSPNANENKDINTTQPKTQSLQDEKDIDANKDSNNTQDSKSIDTTKQKDAKDVIITKPTKSQVWDKLKVQKQETRPFTKLSPKDIASLARKEVEKEKELNLEQDLLDMTNTKLSFEIDFKKHLILKVPTLNLNLSIDEALSEANVKPSTPPPSPKSQDEASQEVALPTSSTQANSDTKAQVAISELKHRILHVQASDLQKLVDISPLLRYYGLKGGDVTLAYPLDDNKTHDFNFKAKLTKLDYPIYSLDNKKLTDISLAGESKKGFLNITSDKNIVYKSKDSLSMLKSGGYAIDLDLALDSKIPFLAELFKDTNSLPISKEEAEQNVKLEQAKASLRKQLGIHALDFNIVLNNMTFLFKGYKIPLEDVNARIKSHKTIIDGSYGNGIFNMTMVDGVMFFDAKNFSGDFINRVLKSNGGGKDIVSGGLFNIKAFMRGDNISATINMNNTAFTDFKVVQNIFALIDTVPSLIVFKNPHLGADGYKVDRGIIKLAMNKDYLGLENIYLVGSTMDINGEGIIDLASKETSVTLNISTIKNVSSLLSRIPVVGYIILGREGKISTNLILTGKYDNPKVNISLAEDVIKAPFNILKRVFTPIDFLIDTIIENNKQ
ncbi:AsmA-like C-terminal domain-containing protein [Helicobacter sp. 11S02629-2]|uniref:YhdP family protein n=1 Tax=Helicobacter sp. 11S02629-2 TaxID=1476195 RepID=UPI000BA6803E|nr:AsmA-like C-terminal domain-containing protein [Helicobacter sp. 11S02629-2]PAF46008.1 hypothetical protein BKH40_00940 [Helicobacter sp. 11S02629-2]